MEKSRLPVATRPPQPNVFVFQLALVHMAEHYGNAVAYLRLKGLVPPSTKS